MKYLPITHEQTDHIKMFSTKEKLQNQDVRHFKFAYLYDLDTFTLTILEEIRNSKNNHIRKTSQQVIT